MAGGRSDFTITLDFEPEDLGEAPEGGVVYISGPMSGYEGHNYAAFDAGRDYAEALGWTVESPADHGVVEGWEWHEYMKRDFDVLHTCNAIALLPGWQQSEGAVIELIAALRMGCSVHRLVGAEFEGVVKESGNVGFDEGEFEELAQRERDVV